jgi:hypothetical protein
MKKLLILLTLFLSYASYGQSIRLISPDDIPGIQVTRFDTFARKDLSKYLGNRAYLFYEYGFKQMCVCDYALQDDKARLEVFIMEDEPSAFGLYSLSITKCNLWNLYSTFSCTNLNQVSAAYGPFFINALNLSKTNSGQGLCQQIVQKIISKNPQDSWYLPPLFQLPQLSPFINSLKYSEGPNGIATGVPQLAELLESLQFQCYSVNIMTPKYTGILARIVFPDFNIMGSFLIQAGLNTSDRSTPVMAMNGAYRSWYKLDDTKLIYLECSSQDLKLSDIIPERPNPMW